MASTSSSMPTVGELDLEALSAYEDALDESETELKRLVEVAAERITRERPRPPAIVLPPVLRTPSSSKHKRSSSSEHSSIEKVNPSEVAAPHRVERIDLVEEARKAAAINRNRLMIGG
ncbi:unnamed protein product [Nippostrongylus brasiliensis]|uniref:Uncharacterized protein n=1 Tax=Nippostrongylus brasiliensis TaxID=27835 RepID=A0A0N4Y7W1_NIPBR|nr:unnamed protein product [Nippostrongylus brasiliensis]